MAKLYDKYTWVDEELANDPLYNIKQSDDISIHDDVKIELSTEVITAGSPINASRMNNIENGINTLDNSIDLENLEEKETPVVGDKLLLADSEDSYAHKSVDVSKVGGSVPETTSENDFQVGGNAGTWVKKNLAETISILGTINPTASKIPLANTDGNLDNWIASNKYVCQGRLTLESGVPVSTSEQSDKATLYFTPYNGDCISIYDTSDSKWKIYQFAELSLVLNSLTASRPHDIFAYINSGTPAIEALAWTDASTRATALTYKNGVLVKNTDNSKRFLGTIYIDASNKCQDTLTKAYIWNNQNQILRRMYMSETTSHTYNGAARLWNNSETNNRFDFVCGLTSTLSTLGFSRIKAGTDAYYGFAYIYYDGVNVGYLLGNYNVQTISAGAGTVLNAGAGYHYLNIYEGGNDNNSTFINFFLYATMMR